MNFKQHFNIPTTQPVEFLNIPLNEDLEAFIDPFLIANNKQDRLIDVIFSQLTGFFTKLNQTYIVPNNRNQGLIFLDNLHEPNEYHLGYSDSNKGKAISGTRADTIFDALRNNILARAAGVTITNEAHNVLLLVNRNTIRFVLWFPGQMAPYFYHCKCYYLFVWLKLIYLHYYLKIEYTVRPRTKICRKAFAV
jgi:hypothetical protein